MNLNGQNCRITERYKTKTINEFKKKVKEFGDRDVFITVFVYREGDLDKPALLLESEHVNYERSFGSGPRFAKLESDWEIDRYHLLLRDLFYDFQDEGLSPKLKEPQHLNRHPKDMLKDDFVYFMNIAALKGEERIKPG